MYSGRYYSTRQNCGDAVSSVTSTQSVFSDNSASTSASAAGSIWSGNSTGTGLTIPPHPTFVGIHGGPQNAANPVLPCEFVIYTQCIHTFSCAEEGEWISHHIHDHLENNLPKRLRCPLCDEWVFDSSKQNVDRETNFFNRMRHWAGHYASGEQVGPLRRDHLMVKHLGDNGIIPRAHFNREMEMSEMRPEIRAPIEGGARPHDFVPPHVQAQKRRESQVMHSLDAEDRKRRRKRSGR